MANCKRELISIDTLLINPENKRYIDPVEGEIQAIIAMFNVVNGKPKEEMVNLARDISENGLNPFEQPIVCYDDEYRKYVVVEGNRRIICIKMMTTYNDNVDIALAISEQAKAIFNLNYTYGSKIECIVYDDMDEANAVLAKIHQDVNGGIGRKQWGHQEKEKNNAEMGNKSRTYAIIEFVKQHPKVERVLLDKMNSKKWTSKLERVVGFSSFKSVYNITFDKDNRLTYSDEYDHVYKMLAKLITDLIENPATGNTRYKNDFEKYCAALPPEYKTQIVQSPDESTANPKKSDNGVKSNKENAFKSTPSEVATPHATTNPNEKNNSDSRDAKEQLPAPKTRTKNVLNNSMALALSKEYTLTERRCLREKGNAILSELESIDIATHPYAAAALCRAIIEYTLNLWCEEYHEVMNKDALLSSYNNVINILQKNSVIDGKRHSALSTVANKEKFIENLNFWMHSDSLLCVRVETLKNGWLVCRILTELYVQLKNPK